MNNQILITYKSVTGFTEQYAKWIADDEGVCRNGETQELI